jgi:hypothetical protein
MVSTVPINEKLFIGGDLNGHVGATNVGFERVHTGFGYGSRNQEGEDVLNFTLAYNLLIANTLFRKRESHLVTFRSEQHSSQIDFILARREDRRACFDCKVLLGSVLSLNTSLWWWTFAFEYVSTGTNGPRLRERSGGSLE